MICQGIVELNGIGTRQHPRHGRAVPRLGAWPASPDTVACHVGRPYRGILAVHSCPHALHRYFVSTAASWTSAGSIFFRLLNA